MLQGNEGTRERARRLRREMSLPEVLLWQVLRTKPQGYKFRKQHPAAGYVLDFYCHAARLIIEVDGEAHGHGDRPERDTERDAHFSAKKLETLRIPAPEILHNLDGVVTLILDRCTERT